MNKEEFLAQLRQALSGLPQGDVAERLDFYNEMIDDRVEDGLPEGAAVAELGPVDTIVSQIVAETPFPRIVRERVTRTQHPRWWTILLLSLGSPVWLSLLITAFVLVLTAYIVLWTVVVSLWAVEVSLIVSAIGGAAAGVLSVFQGNVSQGLILVSGGMVLAGLSIFLFFGARAVTGGAVRLTKKIAFGIKSLFLRKKENAR